MASITSSTSDDDQPTFQAHDLVRHQVFSGNEVEYYWVEIDRAEGSKVWILKSEFNGVVPKQDDELVQMATLRMWPDRA